ncbi:MAG: FtsH protease activity modulator HflK, partial [Verrucomicrobiae bacterium]|nr:FtsH protease activity modulator HflK [Verrucomicrobiae bacterium]
MIKLDIGGKQVEVPAPNFKAIISIVVIILLMWGGLTAMYTVKTEEEAVVTRFGRYIKTEQPGLRFRIPFGIDEVKLIAVRRQLKQEFGFGTPGASNPSQASSPSEQKEEKEMVTGDLNTALVEWVIQYRISDPARYEFNVRDPDSTLRDASESVMREVVGDRTVDEVITIGRQEIEHESLTRLQDLVQLYDIGISIDQVQLKNVNPPLPVQASFNEVNQAQQER